MIILVICRYFLEKPVYKNGDFIRITATVMSDPIDYERSQFIRLAELKIYLPLFPEVNYGDKIVVDGVVRDDTLDQPKLVEIKEEVGPLSRVRKKIINFYEESLPLNYAGLVSGITLGSKGGLSNEFWEKVKYVGVAHVVVASGTNVTFVISFLVNFLSLFLIRRKMIPLVILGILLYLLLSGLEAPLIRASIMASIVFLAQETGRVSSSMHALFLSGLVMLLINPSWIGDIGFILSFVATASLILFEKKIREKLKRIPEFIKESFSTTLAAQVGVTPILFVTFGGFNILSPLVNVLVLWTIPIIMIFGMFAGVVGSVFPLLGKIILYICYPVLWWFIEVVEVFS